MKTEKSALRMKAETFLRRSRISQSIQTKFSRESEYQRLQATEKEALSIIASLIAGRATCSDKAYGIEAWEGIKHLSEVIIELFNAKAIDQMADIARAFQALKDLPPVNLKVRVDKQEDQIDWSDIKGRSEKIGNLFRFKIGEEVEIAGFGGQHAHIEELIFTSPNVDGSPTFQYAIRPIERGFPGEISNMRWLVFVEDQLSPVKKA